MADEQQAKPRHLATAPRSPPAATVAMLRQAFVRQPLRFKQTENHGFRHWDARGLLLEALRCPRRMARGHPLGSVGGDGGGSLWRSHTCSIATTRFAEAWRVDMEAT